MFRSTLLICALVATVLSASDENSKYELKLGRTDNDAKWRGRLEIRRDGGDWGSVCYDKGTKTSFRCSTDYQINTV